MFLLSSDCNIFDNFKVASSGEKTYKEHPQNEIEITNQCDLQEYSTPQGKLSSSWSMSIYDQSGPFILLKLTKHGHRVDIIITQIYCQREKYKLTMCQF